MEVYMVILKRFAVGGIFLLAIFGPILTQAAIRPLSLNELEEIALKIHPSLKAAGEEIKKNEADLKIARQYPNPELEGLISSQKGMENGTYATGYTIALSQPIEWPGRRGKKQEAARFGIDVAQNKLTPGTGQCAGPLPGALLPSFGR